MKIEEKNGAFKQLFNKHLQYLLGLEKQANTVPRNHITPKVIEVGNFEKQLGRELVESLRILRWMWHYWTSSKTIK